MDYRSSPNTRTGFADNIPESDKKENVGPVFIFVGDDLVFSDRLLRIVGLEFDDVDVVRLDNLTAIARLDPAMRASVQLVIVDETSAEKLADFVGELRRFAPETGGVLAYRTVQTARSVLHQSHAAGTGFQMRFLPMNSTFECWLASLRLLALGETFIPSELVDIPASHEPPEKPGTIKPLGVGKSGAGFPCARGAADRPVLSKLTAREKEILALVSEGRRNRVIADHLGLSEHTVKLHVHHIFAKLGVDNRTSASNMFHLHSDR